MNRFLSVILGLFIGLGTTCYADNYLIYESHSQILPEITTYYTPTYVSLRGEIEPTDIQCPIPMENRVRNYTGSQCVWSSIEMLGRWAEEPKLIDPPITSRRDCKGSSGPSSAARKLNDLGVKFKQSYMSKREGVRLIKKAMTEGRGCLFGIPGHAMVLVHYSEREDRVCFVDNSDRSLKVQTITISKFNREWDSWVLVIYADNDIIPYKIGGAARNIPILDIDDPSKKFPENYIPLPKRRTS